MKGGSVIIIFAFIGCSNLSFGQESLKFLTTNPLGSNLFYSSQPAAQTATPKNFALETQNYQLECKLDWLNQSIRHLTFWRINQEFLGMELCEPMDFEWETWGVNKYSDLNLQVKRLEYQRFLSKSY